MVYFAAFRCNANSSKNRVTCTVVHLSALSSQLCDTIHRTRSIMGSNEYVAQIEDKQASEMDCVCMSLSVRSFTF